MGKKKKRQLTPEKAARRAKKNAQIHGASSRVTPADREKASLRSLFEVIKKHDLYQAAQELTGIQAKVMFNMCNDPETVDATSRSKILQRKNEIAARVPQ
jgi:hypothetical protein